jgi:hypothetical protein
MATRVFVIASVAFGALGVAFLLTMPRGTDTASGLNDGLFMLLGITGFVVLSSFALSVAGLYLRSDD